MSPKEDIYKKINIKMNQLNFALRNISDKLRKCLRTPGLPAFYFRNYFLSLLDSVDPDFYIISYPKCGRTWLRVLLNNYLTLSRQAGEGRFYNQSIVSMNNGRTLKFDHDKGNWVPCPLKSSQLSFSQDKYNAKRIVFLVRDPRDVLVSSWYHLKYRENIYRGNLSQFIRDELVGVKKIIAFYNMWIDNKEKTEEFVLLSYEDFKQNEIGSFKKLIEFFELKLDTRILEESIARSNFKRMKQMEKSGQIDEPWMKPGLEGGDNTYKVRRGVVGGYKEELSQIDIEYLNQKIQEFLHPVLAFYK